MKKVKVSYLVKGSWGHDEEYSGEEAVMVLGSSKDELIRNFVDFHDGDYSGGDVTDASVTDLSSAERHYITNDIWVEADSVVVLGDNGKTGDAKITLCAGLNPKNNTWVCYLHTNGDDELIHDANLPEIDREYGISEIMDACAASKNVGIQEFGEWLSDENACQKSE